MPIDGVGKESRSQIDPKRQQMAHEAFQLRIAEALVDRAHLWIAVCAFTVIPWKTENVILDAENIIGPPQVSCYLCETAYDERERFQPCNGTM